MLLEIYIGFVYPISEVRSEASVRLELQNRKILVLVFEWPFT